MKQSDLAKVIRSRLKRTCSLNKQTFLYVTLAARKCAMITFGAERAENCEKEREEGSEISRYVEIIHERAVSRKVCKLSSMIHCRPKDSLACNIHEKFISRRGHPFAIPAYTIPCDARIKFTPNNVVSWFLSLLCFQAPSRH